LNHWHIDCAVRVVRHRGVIAYPTEAVFGLGCAPCYPEAVRRILSLKRRNPAKGLIVVASELSQLQGLIDLDALGSGKERVLATWPGPVTWIIPARPGVPDWLTGAHPGLAVRLSAHVQVRALCDRVGALVSTSANPEGAPPARDARRVRAYFGDALDYILPGTVGGRSSPSEIRDARSGTVLRPGA
jgi:L-threonylcarbamoyladenylate synthase